MLVRTWMTKDPVTIPSSATMQEAADVMQEHGFRHLPVVDKGKLVGIVTLSDLRRAAPSSATTLSVWELNYLVDKVTVADIMTADPISVTPDTAVEDAALISSKHRFGAVPVVEEGRLVGIITSSDLFDLMMRVFSGREGFSRITLENIRPVPGTARKIVDILDAHDVYFSSILAFPQHGGELYTYWVRVRPGRLDEVVADLEAADLPVTSVS